MPMVEIVVEGTEWSCPTTWDRVTIAQGRGINRAVKGTSREIESYQQILTTLTSMSPKIVEKIDPTQLESFAYRYLTPLIDDMKGEALVAYPKKKRDEKQIPSLDLTAEQFCRATDLYIEDRVENAKQITEIVLGRRARVSDNTAMSVVWSAFNLLSEAHRFIKESYPKSRTEHLIAHEITHWRELPIVVARGIASEIELVKEMNYIQMMQILECQIKMSKAQSRAL